MNSEQKPKGLFITFEGAEGVGKSTAIKYVDQLLNQANITHILTREPGGTEIAEAIRKTLLAHYQETMSVKTELLLMFASRAQHLEKIIKPSLLKGQHVLCDRFTEASYAYQGGGRGINAKHIAYLENWVQDEIRPDWVILFDAPVEVGLARIRGRESEDRIESEKIEFFERVRDIYLARAKQFPEKFKIINAEKPVADIQLQLKEIIKNIFGCEQ